MTEPTAVHGLVLVAASGLLTTAESVALLTSCCALWHSPELLHRVADSLVRPSLLELHCAKGNAARAHELLANGADARTPDYEGKTPLQYACEGGNLSIVDKLISAGAEVDERCVMSAATGNHARLLERLLPLCPSGEPLQHALQGLMRTACRLGRQEVVSEILAHQPELCRVQGALDGACEGGHFAIVKALLASGADVKPAELSLLRSAIGARHVELVSLLLDSVISSNAINDGLAFACKEKRPSPQLVTITKRLIDAGASPCGAADSPSASPLCAAAESGQADLVSLLLRHGANANCSVTKQGPLLDAVTVSALHLAAQHGHVDTVKVLLDAGACPMTKIETNSEERYLAGDASAPYHAGTTPLMLACRHKSSKAAYEVAKSILVPSPAFSVLAEEAHGGTALHFAAAAGHCDVVALLLEAGAAVDSTDRFGYTPLLIAGLNKQPAVFQQLLAAGADGFGSNHLAAPLVEPRKQRPAYVPSSSGSPALEEFLFSAIHWAARFVLPGAIKIILEAVETQQQAAQVATLGVINFERFTPLYILCRDGPPETAKMGSHCPVLEAAELLLAASKTAGVVGASSGAYPCLSESLLVAVKACKTQLACMLIEAGANVGAMMAPVFTRNHILTSACATGDTRLVGMVLERLTSEQLRELDTLPVALRAACMGGRLPMVHMLLSHSATAALMTGMFEGGLQAVAAMEVCVTQLGNVELLKVLVTKLRECSPQSRVPYTLTPVLEKAALSGNVAAVELLLDAGTALPIELTCSMLTQPFIQQLLLRRGVSPNQLNSAGETPLWLLLRKGANNAAARVLMDYGGDIIPPLRQTPVTLTSLSSAPSAVDAPAADLTPKQVSARLLASLSGSYSNQTLERVLLLVEAGLRCRIPIDVRQSALILAAGWGKPAIVRDLLQRFRLDPRVPAPTAAIGLPFLALQRAITACLSRSPTPEVRRDYARVIATLLEYCPGAANASIEADAPGERTVCPPPLTVACESTAPGAGPQWHAAQAWAVRCLLRRGADVNATACVEAAQGPVTALVCALRHGRANIAALLRAAGARESI